MSALPGYDAWKTGESESCESLCGSCSRDTKREDHALWCAEHPEYPQRAEGIACKAIAEHFADMHLAPDDYAVSVEHDYSTDAPIVTIVAHFTRAQIEEIA